MSEARRYRDDHQSSQKRMGESSSPHYSRDSGKAKQNDLFASKKLDGFAVADSLVTSNINDVKFRTFDEGGIIGAATFMPSLSDMNDNSELQEFSFLNLHGVCQAEKDILHKIIHNSQWYSDSLFCFMRRSPSPSGLHDSVDPSERCLTEAGGDIEGDGIPEVSGDPDNASETLQDERMQMQNGPLLDLSQQHVNPVEDGGISGVVGQGVPPANIRSFYPSQPHLVVSSTGPGQAIPPTSVQIPVSGAQMAMYPQQMQQIMQPGHGGYPMPVGYPPVHYGYSQHGGQPHVTYVSPTGEAISPESVHMPPPTVSAHQKGHHDGHHSMSHSSSSSGPGGYSKNRNHRRDNVKQQQQQQQQQQSYYYPSYGYAPGMPYSHQQLAQNVTGSPIIMQAPGNIYPYHQPHPSLYQQGAAVSGDIDHHQSGVGMPQMGHISGEIPPYAQHHHVPHMYHHSPTHSGNRMVNYSQSTRGGMAAPSTTTVEHSVNASLEVQPEVDVTYGSAEKSNDTDFSQPSAIVAGGRDRTESTATAGSAKLESENSQKKSLITETPAVSAEVVAPSCEPAFGMRDEGPLVSNSVNEPLSEPIRDKDVVRIATPPPSEMISSSKGANNTGGSSLGDSQTKVDKIKLSNTETPAVNGEIKDIKSGRNILRDKLSAEPVTASANNKKELEAEARQSRNPNSIKSPNEAKSKLASVSLNSSNSSNNNVRSVNVISNSSTSGAGISSTTKDILEKKLVENESSSGEFPQLSNSGNSGALANSSSSTASAAKGRSWASIASVKSQMAASDGANFKRVSGASVHDQGSGDGLAICGESRLSAGEHLSFVPSSQFDKDLAKSCMESVSDIVNYTDENDPVALALGKFLRNYTLDHHSIALTPRGLCNQGNYCYINATLQSLLACPPFVNLFRAMGEILNKKPCRATPIIQNVFELVSQFDPLLRGNANKKDRMKDSFNVGANLEPLGIRKCLELLEGSTFKVEGRQEDAEEFLSHLLNGLHDEMLKVMKLVEQVGKVKDSGSGKPPTAVPSSNLPVLPGATNGGVVEVSDEDDDQWQVMGARNKSCLTRKTAISRTPISEAFLGQMCYFYRESSTGNHKSATLQPFYTLQLDIQNENIRSVRDALEAISAREEVSGIMSANGAEVEAWRQLTLEELPVVLILHLKRFVYEKNGNKIKKIDKKLDFAIDLEIGKEMLSVSAKQKYGPRQRSYKLFGVVYHDGEEAHKGHYIADCFHASSGSMWGQCGWLRYDDTSVKQIPELQMLNPQPPRVPYLLYYRRGDTLLSHVTQQQQHKKDRP